MNVSDSKIKGYSEIFDIRAQMYHRAMERFPSVRRHEFMLPLSKLAPFSQGVLVDVPSGGGYLGHYLSEKVTLCCLEPSEEFSVICGMNGYSSMHYTADSFPLKDEFADGLISIAGLHHIKDKVTFFSEAYRVLKNGSRACFTDVKAGSSVALFLDDIVDRYTSTGHYGYYLSDHTLDEIQKGGFTDVEVSTLSYPWVFDDVESMVEFCKLLFGMEKASLDQVHNGIEKYLTYTDCEGHVFLDWQLEFFTATK